MSDWIDQFIFYDELDEESRSVLRAALKQHGEASVETAFDEWRHLRTTLGRSFEVLVKDRRQLINFAMWRYGNASILTSDELDEVEENLSHFEEAMRSSIAFRAVVNRIGEEQSDFEATWRLHAGDGGVQRGSASLADVRRRRSSRRIADLIWRSAAVFAIAASSVALYLGLGFDPATVTVQSQENGVRSVALEDGSLVRLVDGAELQYLRPTSESPFDRRVQLTGRALFNVAPGDGRFVVETPAAVTTVWGTTFGLDSDESFTEVVVAEGRVSVVSRRDGQHPVLVEPGEMTRVVGLRRPSPPTRVNVTDALSYTGLFVFQKEETFMIADRLAEHFGVPVEVHPQLAEETLTGTFERDWSLNYILQAVARTLDARVEGSEANGFELVPLERR
jgi:ferric-dicitrate binding protein FerR (iron transport regulator)